MKRFAAWPIRQQLRFMILALALPLAALVVFHVARDAAEVEAAGGERLGALAQAGADESARFIARTETLLAGLAQRPAVAAMGRGGCDPVFDAFKALHRDYANLLLVDADGLVRCSALPLAGGPAPRLGPMYLLERLRAERSLVVGRPEIGFVSGRWVFPVVYPVSDAARDLPGLVGVSIDLASLQLLGAHAAAGIDLLLIDGEGMVMSASAGSGKTIGARLDAGLLQAGAPGATRGWHVAEGADGRMLVARAAVAGSAWSVMALADHAPLRARIWRSAMLNGAFAAAVLLLGFWLARRVERAITAPIGRLAESARAVAGGATMRVEPAGSEEVSDVGEAFNRMLDALDAEIRRARRVEAELNTVLDSVEEVVFSLSADGATLHYLSPGADRLYGAEARHLAADPRRRHARVGEEDRPHLEAMARQIEQTGWGVAEYRLRREDGTLRWLRERCQLLRDGEGHPWRLTGIVSDITFLHELVAGLKDSEARFRSLTALSSDWYWEQDAELRFTAMTGAPGGREGYFLDAGAAGRRRWEMPTHGLDAAQWAAHRAQLERHEAFRDLEYGVVGEEGETTWVSVSGEPIFDAAGRFAGYRGVGRDISARRRMEQALRESEARLRRAMEATSEGVWDYDLAAGDTYFSPRFAELLGYDGQAALKRDFSYAEALHPEDRARCVAAQEGALRDAGRFDETFRLRCRDGGYRWFHGRGIVAADGAAGPRHFIGALADVTARREAEAELRKLSTAVEQSPVSIVITDPRGDIEYVNPRFCQVTGYSLEEVRGRNPRILKSGATPDAEYRRLWQTITRGEEWSGELHNRRKNGELFWEFVRIIPLVAADGVVTNFMAVKEDITLRKDLTAREQLRQEQMLHHARLAAMGEMAAALAHELNQPLAAIANFSGVAEHQLAAPQPDLAQVGEVVRVIGDQALRAGDIVWRVREFSRRRESKREATDLNALIRDVARLADVAAKAHDVHYEFDLAPGLPPVRVDRIQIEQVLLNLIRNGVEAMDGSAGEKRLVLASRFTECGGAVQLSVRDHGCGLPDRIAVDLFTPFFTTKPEGMGMGLSISRGIVEAHGGRLWAAPNDDGGTTFHLTLPLGQEDRQ